MSDVKISALNAVTELTGSEVIPVVQEVEGVKSTVNVTTATLKEFSTKDVAYISNLYKVIAGAEATENTLVIDPEAGVMQTVTLTQPSTEISLGDVTETSGLYREVVLHLTQGSGANSATWGSNIHWSNELQPTLSYKEGYMDVVTLYTLDDGVTWIGMTNGGWINVQ